MPNAGKIRRTLRAVRRARSELRAEPKQQAVADEHIRRLEELDSGSRGGRAGVNVGAQSVLARAEAFLHRGDSRPGA